MKQIILSDIHGNLEALKSVLESAEKEGEIKYCLGDIIGYGANPSECLSLIRQFHLITVAGNHEVAVVHPGLTAVFNPEARRAIFWTRDHLTNQELTEIESFPIQRILGEIVLVHSSLIEPEYWHYLYSEEDVEANFQCIKEGQICFFGHSHVPVIYSWKAGKLSVLSTEKEERLDLSAKYLINVGAVGQPRDGDPRAAYGVFDPDERTIIVRRVEYDIATAQKKIIEANLPAFLASRLSLGR